MISFTNVSQISLSETPHILRNISSYTNTDISTYINHHILLPIKIYPSMIFDIGDLLNLRPEMRAPPRLADVHTNSKILLETPNKIETIQRKLECSVQKGVGSSIDVVAGNMTTIGEEKQKKLKKLLLNVHIQNSLGPVHVVISHENAVGDLIKAAIEIYVKEKRRPLLPSRDSRCYELHYSQFSLESLKPGEKLLNLESRSFFLCPKPNCSINSSSKDKAKATAKFPLLLAKFMDLLV